MTGPLRLEFTVLGRAQPAGSKRAFAVHRGGVPTGRVAVTDDNPKSKSWQQEISHVARQALIDVTEGDRFAALLTGPLGLDVRFVLARPRSHYRQGRRAHLLRAGAPAYPTVRPDATKLLRGLEDALSGQVWADDALVVYQVARKLYGEPERCEVRVWQIEDAPAPSEARAAA